MAEKQEITDKAAIATGVLLEWLLECYLLVVLLVSIYLISTSLVTHILVVPICTPVVEYN
jgi:hypothetical protein